jgi:hypothetical protein
MSKENPLWGAPRIHGELLKLRFEIAESTVSKYMIRRRGPPSQTWRTFLRNHAHAIAAIDLCVVPTLTFECLFAFLVVGHGRRQLLWFAVTARAKSSIPITPGHSHEAVDGAAHPSEQYWADAGERGSRLQAGAATWMGWRQTSQAAEGTQASRRMMRWFCLIARIRTGWSFRERQVSLIKAWISVRFPSDWAILNRLPLGNGRRLRSYGGNDTRSLVITLPMSKADQFRQYAE